MLEVRDLTVSNRPIIAVRDVTMGARRNRRPAQRQRRRQDKRCPGDCRRTRIAVISTVQMIIAVVTILIVNVFYGIDKLTAA